MDGLLRQFAGLVLGCLVVLVGVIAGGPREVRPAFAVSVVGAEPTLINGQGKAAKLDCDSSGLGRAYCPKDIKDVDGNPVDCGTSHDVPIKTKGLDRTTLYVKDVNGVGDCRVDDEEQANANEEYCGIFYKPIPDPRLYGQACTVVPAPTPTPTPSPTPTPGPTPAPKQD